MHQQNPVDAPPESRGTTRIRRAPTESCMHLQRVFIFSFVHRGGGGGVSLATPVD